MNTIKTSVLIMAGLLAGCAATSPQEARDLGPEKRYTFTVDADYQAVYRRIIEPMRNCYQGSMITAQAMVHGDLYPETQTASIVSGVYGVAGASILRVVDLSGADGKTDVVAIFPRGNVETMGGVVKAWANGGTHDGC